MKKKVFGIGFHKTGTKSLASALRRLGYLVSGPDFVKHPTLSEDVRALAYKRAQQFDGFQDNPWPILYREVDGWFPESKFILTIRPTDQWMASVINYFGQDSTSMREWIYGTGQGCPSGNEAVYVTRYERHNSDVLDYFRDRPQDLLVLRISEGDGWGTLCPFLGVPIVSEPFPRTNVGRAAAGRVSSA